MNHYKPRKKAVVLCVVLVLVLVAMIGGLRILESTVFSSPEEETVATKTVSRDGMNYFPRQDITVILVMGIDERGPVVSSQSYRNYGESDAVVLMILDQKAETYSLLCLNRDTMVDMPVLGIGGKRAGTFHGQLALSHTYGDGLETSCENTRRTVSDLLGGITIDHYVALNMDGIGILNDAVGGVTVDVVDDFSLVDPSITGHITLNGMQALTYVQTRHDVGDQLNITRMGRHETYMKGLMTSMRQKLDSSDTFALSLYDKLDEYMVTDCSANVISGLMERCIHYSLEEIVSPQGKNVLTEEYYEFYLDEAALDELILRLFYAPKELLTALRKFSRRAVLHL